MNLTRSRKFLGAGVLLILCSLLIILFSLTPLWAQNGEKQKESPAVTTRLNAAENLNKANLDKNNLNSRQENPIKSFDKTSLPTKKRKPNLHPAFVHFPIVLLFLAPVLYCLAIFLKKQDYKILTAFLVLGGLIFSLLASTIFHPHTTGLPINIEEILLKHETFAGVTEAVTLLALLLTVLSYKKRFSTKTFELFVLFVLVLSFITIGMAGHYGGKLTYTYGVGGQGKYMKNN